MQTLAEATYTRVHPPSSTPSGSTVSDNALDLSSYRQPNEYRPTKQLQLVRSVKANWIEPRDEMKMISICVVLMANEFFFWALKRVL